MEHARAKCRPLLGTVLAIVGARRGSADLGLPTIDSQFATSPMVSNDSTVTTSSLLESLFVHQDSATWALFDSRMRPVMLGTARRMGLREADTQEVVQDCLMRVVTSYRKGGYVRTGGRLRSWILAILRNRIRDLYRHRGNEPGQHSQSILASLPAASELDEIWIEEARRQLTLDVLAFLRRCGEFDERTLLAFELHVLVGRDAKDVARELEMSVWGIYKARQRCGARFGELAADFSFAYGFIDS